MRDRDSGAKFMAVPAPKSSGLIVAIRESGKNIDYVKPGPPKIIHRCGALKKIKTCCII